jgi:hypothetical protein
VRGVPPPLGVGTFFLVFVDACGVGFGVLAFCLQKNKNIIIRVNFYQGYGFKKLGVQNTPSNGSYLRTQDWILGDRFLKSRGVA